MKKYNFNLQSVLEVRESIEKDWEARLGLANAKCQEVINKIDLLEQKLQVSKLSSVDIIQMEVKSIYEQRLEFQISQEKAELRERESERDRVKEVYLEKSRDRKVIDKLKDKYTKQYNKELNKADILFIDEINNASKIREKMLGGSVDG